MLQRCFDVKLQKCFVVKEASPAFPSGCRWVDNDWVLIFGWTISLKIRRLSWNEIKSTNHTHRKTLNKQNINSSITSTNWWEHKQNKNTLFLVSFTQSKTTNAVFDFQLTRNDDINADVIVAVVQLWFGYVEDRDLVSLTRVHDYHVSWEKPLKTDQNIFSVRYLKLVWWLTKTSCWTLHKAMKLWFLPDPDQSMCFRVSSYIHTFCCTYNPH